MSNAFSICFVFPLSRAKSQSFLTETPETIKAAIPAVIGFMPNKAKPEPDPSAATEQWDWEGEHGDSIQGC